MDQKDRRGKRTEYIKYPLNMKNGLYIVLKFSMHLYIITFFNPLRIQGNIILSLHMNKLYMENYIFTYYICASVNKNQSV